MRSTPARRPRSSLSGMGPASRRSASAEVRPRYPIVIADHECLLLNPLVSQSSRRRVHPQAAGDLHHVQAGRPLTGQVRNHHYVARPRRLDAQDVLLLLKCIASGREVLALLVAAGIGVHVQTPMNASADGPK